MNQLREKALSIIDCLRAHGYKAYLCGGCVRDLLLGLTPKDYDIVTDAQPRDVQRLFKRTVQVGMQFGIICVVLGKDTFEVATFRQDGVYEDGRRPTCVQFCDEQEDARRRDFTINGLFLDPKNDAIIDYVGGRADLEHRRICTIGQPQERFAEDYLRMLRAIRFACQLDFTIDADTWQVICQRAASIQRISSERIRDELLKMLIGRNPAMALTLLEQSGLLQHFLPEVSRLQHEPCPRHARSLFACVVDALRQGAPFADGARAFVVLLWHVGRQEVAKETTRQAVVELCRRLKLPSQTGELVANCVAWQPAMQQVTNLRKADLKKFLRLPFVHDLLALYELHIMTGEVDAGPHQYCQNKLQELGHALRPAPLITGTDLIALGLQPGPLFKTILDFVEDQQLEDKIDNQQDAMDLVRQKFAQSLPGVAGDCSGGDARSVPTEGDKS